MGVESRPEGGVERRVRRLTSGEGSGVESG